MIYEKVVYTKVEPSVVKKHRKAFKKIKSQFIRWCAYQKMFDNVFSAEEIKLAKKGKLPEDCDIHHNLPLSGTYDPDVNQFFNLTVIHKNTHKRINKECFQAQLKDLYKLPYGTELEIEIPIFNMVDAQGIKKERNSQRTNQRSLAIISSRRNSNSL